MAIFEIWSHIYALVTWTAIFLFVLPQKPRTTGEHHCAQPMIEMETCKFIAPDWPETAILPTVASQLARIHRHESPGITFLYF